ncbi:MAG: ribonuclease P protein component [Alphaproteobacteria bacterium]|nr:ribonuclease P protein component [Alphaproteobacteria bacterium]
MKVLILKKRKDFLRAAKGVKSVFPSLILQAAPSLCTQSKKVFEDACFLGYTATKKIGKANVRNKVKRRLRAAAALIFPNHALPKIDYVLIGRFNTADVPFDVLTAHMSQALTDANYQLANKEKSKNEKIYDIAD